MPNSSPRGIQFSKSIHEPDEHEVLRLNLNKVTESYDCLACPLIVILFLYIDFFRNAATNLAKN
uniref:Uncharacterized protein n=1 Tax=Glossina palpalis gambiensis TaxID=67801 RepID=A0A1B0AUE7_9MUSC